MTPSMREHLAHARQSFEERPPTPLTPSQQRVVALFGRVTPQPAQAPALRAA